MTELRRARDHILHLEDELAKEYLEGLATLILYFVPGGMHLVQAVRTRECRGIFYFAGYVLLVPFFWTFTWFGVLLAASWVTFIGDWRRWRRTNTL